MKKVLLATVLLLASGVLFASKLKPGFEKAEYLEMLSVFSRQRDTLIDERIPAPERFQRVYRSEVMGLENRWELWVSKDSTATISIRGTTASKESWLENFYSAMVPAKGELKLTNDFTFQYDLADDPKAAVHTGWLIGTAFLSRDILPKLDSLSEAGIKDIYIMGHSQGGAIAYLMTSYLERLKKAGKVNSEIQFKTYCSAAPKPGNLYYAYEFEAMTYGGWAFNVVNSADWVPEVPFTVQTVNDFDENSLFGNAKNVIKKAPFPKDLAFAYVYGRLTRPSKKANKRYQKYLGKVMGKYIGKSLPEYESPKYYNSSNYCRAGTTIVLLTDDEYDKEFPDDETSIWTHHKPIAYRYLALKL